MKLKKLIVNADDFGMTEGNTLATIICHESGILTSTTLMVNMPYAREAARLALKHPDLGVGIHLVLTIGRPLIEGAKSFTDENGNFRRPNSMKTVSLMLDLKNSIANGKLRLKNLLN